MPAGRPRTLDRDAINKKLLKYIEDNEIPILAEFAYTNDICREQLYEMPELAYAIKKCHQKKESQLERLALTAQVNTTMAVFSLKQLGWSDKQEIKHAGSLDIVQMTPAEREKRIAELLANG
jgi:Holliday junction resolvasome RuvABC DNA-binding subunit